MYLVGRLIGRRYLGVVPKVIPKVYAFREFFTSPSLFSPILTFDECGISSERQKLLKRSDISALFPVQSECFRPIIEGRNVVTKAPTGQGKTLAFLLPILELIEKNERSSSPKVLIIEPTRELSEQTFMQGTKITTKSRFLSIYGGVSYNPQIESIRRGVDVLVATPGRLNDLCDQGHLKLDSIEIIVIDEADRMLEMGFNEQVDIILSRCINMRQSLLFSATIPPWVNNVISSKMVDPLYIDLVGEQIMNSDIVHYSQFYRSHAELVNIIRYCVNKVTNEEKSPKILLFAPTKASCTSLSSMFPGCSVLHGDVSQSGRQMALNNFKQGLNPLLIATDVAARGIDVDKVSLVISIVQKDRYIDYIHKSGRTGRKGEVGSSLCLLRDEDSNILRNLESHLKKNFLPYIPESDVNNLNNIFSSDVIEKIANIRVVKGINDMKKALKDKNIGQEDMVDKLLSYIYNNNISKSNITISGLDYVTSNSYSNRPQYNNSSNRNSPRSFRSTPSSQSFNYNRESFGSFRDNRDTHRNEFDFNNGNGTKSFSFRSNSGMDRKDDNNGQYRFSPRNESSFNNFNSSDRYNGSGMTSQSNQYQSDIRNNKSVGNGWNDRTNDRMTGNNSHNMKDGSDDQTDMNCKILSGGTPDDSSNKSIFSFFKLNSKLNANHFPDKN